ncbi:MAG: zinc-binding dehydrogenase [bacterium]|nr:zinc-binding dehydrogenase [bacterium]
METNPTVVFAKPTKVILEDRPIPAPAEGELLVRTRRTLISTGTELTILNGQFPRESAWANYGKFPFTPGYNSVGEVIDTGLGVDKSWIGRKVACHARHTAYSVLKPGSIRPILRDISDEEAVFFTLAEIVMNGIRRGELTWGESAAVYGLGLIGQLAVRFAHLAGASHVFGIDVVQKRLDLLPQSPRIHPLNPEKENTVETIGKITRDRLADVVYEATGNPDLIPREFEALKRQGRLVILSSPRHRTKEFDFHDLCNAPSYTIIGAHNGSHPAYETPYNQWTRPRHGELFFDLVANGELNVKPLISHRAPFAQAPELYTMLMEDRSQAMGVILEWNT